MSHRAKALSFGSGSCQSVRLMSPRSVPRERGASHLHALPNRSINLPSRSHLTLSSSAQLPRRIPTLKPRGDLASSSRALLLRAQTLRGRVPTRGLMSRRVDGPGLLHPCADCLRRTAKGHRRMVHRTHRILHSDVSMIPRTMNPRKTTGYVRTICLLSDALPSGTRS